MVRKYRFMSERIANTYRNSVISIASDVFSDMPSGYSVQKAIDLAAKALGRELSDHDMRQALGYLYAEKDALSHAIANALAQHLRSKTYSFLNQNIDIDRIFKTNEEEN